MKDLYDAVGWLVTRPIEMQLALAALVLAAAALSAVVTFGGRRD